MILSHLLDLQEEGKSNILSINKIEWWLLKYSENYKETYNLIYSQNLFELADGSIVRLPPCVKPTTSQEKFVELYEVLSTIADLHRNEEYFKEEIIIYHSVKDSQSELKKWITKNETFGADKYVCFFIDYLDYDEDERVEHLKIFVQCIKELDIFIERRNFKHTIEFLEIFNELYWVQEILPERLEKIRTNID